MSRSTRFKRGAGAAAAVLIAMAGTFAVTSSPAQAAGDGKVTSSNSLNVRFAPSKYANKVGSVGSGKVIPLSCKVKGSAVDGVRTWYLLPGDGTPAWVSGRYVKHVDGTPTTRWCTGGGHATVKATAGINVRQGPNLRDRKVGSFARGTKVTVACKIKAQYVNGNRIWYRLPDSSNWVSARYAANVGDAPGWCTER